MGAVDVVSRCKRNKDLAFMEKRFQPTVRMSLVVHDGSATYFCLRRPRQILLLPW